jgi:prepilin-type N-terminal cleavage/methylation domain-containing protein
MSAHSTRRGNGFTLPELIITIAMVGIVMAMAAPLFVFAFKNYFSLEYEGSQYSSIAGQSQRVANVIRGLSGINSADGNSMDIYAYFYPNDTYASKVKYYLSSDQTKLYADVTPMTANPPDGTPITSQKKTYTIIDNFKKVSGVNLFEYVDLNNNTISLPMSDLGSIKTIKVNLAVPKDKSDSSAKQSITLSVNLRNRKTNL